MLFISMGKAIAGTPQERIARRAQWQYPEGIRLVAEYWPIGGDYSVISIVEGDSVPAMLAAITQWADVFDITITPAVTLEEGLGLAQQLK
jgi:hypothetical protein